jgi:hypothetical protein
MPVAILLIGDESAARRRVPMDADGRHVDAVSAEPLYVERAKIVVAHAADHAARLAKASNLVDEDRRRTAWVRSNECAWLKECLSAPGGHHLNKNLAQGDDSFPAVVHAGRQDQRPSDFK